MRIPTLFALVLLGATATTTTMAAQGEVYVPTERPTPDIIEPPSNYLRAIDRGTRTDRGVPGPDYWQQWTDYTIDVRLDPDDKLLTGQALVLPCWRARCCSR